MSETHNPVTNRPRNPQIWQHDRWLKLIGIDKGPWHGGTWGGNCGAVHYYEGSPPKIQPFTGDSYVTTSQSWAAKDWIPGYWAQCMLKHRHQGSHEGAGHRWDRTDLIHSARFGHLKAARADFDEYDIYSPWVTN